MHLITYNPLAADQYDGESDPKRILCIAEGEGRNAVYLAEQGFDVTAWDFAPAAIEKTKKLAAEKEVVVTTELHDLAEVEWRDEEWDAIVNIFGHVPKSVMDRTLAGIKKALKPGGYFVSELYTKEQLQYGTGGGRNVDLLCDPQELLETFFSSYFIKHFYIGEAH